MGSRTGVPIEEVGERYDLRNRTPFSVKCPELASEWYFEKNCGWGPEDFSYGSQVIAWWKCPAGPEHIWQARILKRGTRGDGCPFCRGFRPSTTNSIASLFPELVTEWHPTKNGKLTPADVVAGTAVQYWWKCKKNHVWKARPANRTHNGSGCRKCWDEGLTDWFAQTLEKQRPLKKYSLAAQYPHLKKQWHTTKNAGKIPEEFRPGSRSRVWWICTVSNEHEWQTSITDRTMKGTSCPFCIDKRVWSGNSLKTLHPEVAAELHPSLNGALKSTMLMARTTKKVWWQCTRNAKHVWLDAVRNRTVRSSSCPHCPIAVPESQSLAALYPEIASQWHWQRNEPMKPCHFKPTSTKKVWWQCKVHKTHQWEASIYSRKRGSRCPYCSNQKVCTTNSLAKLFPKLAKEWHPKRNSGISPRDVVPGSNKKVWWLCQKNSSHEWNTQLRSRSVDKTGCPYCSGNLLAKTDSLAYRFKAISNEWHPTRNSKTAKEVNYRSQQVVWWRCSQNPRHVWRKSVFSRTENKSKCPKCHRV